jgi:hypothetical protein
MTFFGYAAPSNEARWQGGKDVWIFFLTSLPFTIICLVCWGYSKAIEEWLHHKFSQSAKQINSPKGVQNSATTDSKKTTMAEGQENSGEYEIQETERRDSDTTLRGTMPYPR